MSIFESVISILVPHYCISCGLEGSLLCNVCKPRVISFSKGICYRCDGPTQNFKTCKNCLPKSSLRRVYIRSEYKGYSKELLQLLKYNRAKSAAIVISELLLEILPISSEKYVLVSIPTASSRIRQRGYDHAILIAKDIARRTRLPYLQLLKRVGQTRQVGTKKAMRKLQMKNAFRVIKSDQVLNSKIILIDDVITTGSTLESAADILIKAGAKSVDALIFAKAT